MQSRRRRPSAAALLGSTAEAVCRTAPCPVLVTHAGERKWAGFSSGEIGLRRLLVAYDFSDTQELALSYGLSLAQEYQAELHLIYTPPSQTGPATPELAWVLPGSDSGFHQTPRRHGLPAEAYVRCGVKQAVSEAQPYREVLAYAEVHEIDLICMGVRVAGFGMRARRQPNVDHVLRQAPCPVLLAPAQAVDLRSRWVAELTRSFLKQAD
jgi:nucleotide-binding universal stress UspA family protein